MNEATLLKQALRALEGRLPPGWKQRGITSKSKATDELGGIVEIASPDGVTGRLAVEAKQRLFPRDVRPLKDRLNQVAAAPYLVVAPYLPRSTRRSLQAEGINYADTTGNVRLVMDRPGVYLEASGADSRSLSFRGTTSIIARSQGRAYRSGAVRRCHATVDLGPCWRRRRGRELRIANGRLARTRGVTDAGVARPRPGGAASRTDPAVGRGLRSSEEQRRPFVLGSARVENFTKALRASTLKYAVTGSLAAARVAPLRRLDWRWRTSTILSVSPPH